MRVNEDKKKQNVVRSEKKMFKSFQLKHLFFIFLLKKKIRKAWNVCDCYVHQRLEQPAKPLDRFGKTFEGEGGEFYALYFLMTNERFSEIWAMEI